MSDCFEPGREVLTYTRVDKVIEHLVRALREPDWVRATRQAGCARAEHTYGLRLKRILKDADLPFGDPADES